MDTKLRNISTNKLTKVMAFIVVVISITAALLQMQYLMELDYNPESLLVKDYINSQEFTTQVNTSWIETNSLLESSEETQVIPQERDYYYFVTDGEHTFSNTENQDKSFFQQYEDTFYAFENGSWEVGKEVAQNRFPRHYNYTEEGYTTYIAFPDSFMEEKQQEWQENREVLIPYGIGILSCLVLALLLIIYLIAVTGRRPQDRELHLSKLENIYSDILLAIMFPLGAIWVVVIANSFNAWDYGSNGFGINQIYSMILVGSGTGLITIAYGIIILSLVRKIKAGRLLKHSLIYRIFYHIKDFFKSLFDGRRFEKYPLTKSLYYRQMIFILVSAFMVFLTFLFLFAPPLILLPPILEIGIVYLYIKGNN